jgi:hypothetical protein
VGEQSLHGALTIFLILFPDRPEYGPVMVEKRCVLVAAASVDQSVTLPNLDYSRDSGMRLPVSA